MKSRTIRKVTLVLLAAGGVVGAPKLGRAVIVPFTEEFAVDSANWRDVTGTTALAWVSSGGPDGGAYASMTFNFVNSTTVDTPPLFRAHDEYGSSGGAFEGNWVAADVNRVRFFVRQNSGVPLTFFIRFASPANFPGGVSVLDGKTETVPSGQWTELCVPIPDPDMVFEGPFSFEQVFGNIGHVQIGVLVPPSLAGHDESFTFGLDKVAIDSGVQCPTLSPAGAGVFAGMLALAGVLILRRRGRPRQAWGMP
jgi:hypothetical protein